MIEKMSTILEEQETIRKEDSRKYVRMSRERKREKKSNIIIAKYRGRGGGCLKAKHWNFHREQQLTPC